MIYLSSCSRLSVGLAFVEQPESLQSLHNCRTTSASRADACIPCLLNCLSHALATLQFHLIRGKSYISSSSKFNVSLVIRTISISSDVLAIRFLHCTIQRDTESYFKHHAITGKLPPEGQGWSPCDSGLRHLLGLGYYYSDLHQRRYN